MNMVCLAVAIITSNNWNLRDYMLLFCTLITFEALSHLCEHDCCAFFIMLSVKAVLLWANAIGLACPQPFWGTLSGRFEPRAARTVSLTVITGFTVGALSAFNIFISKNICVTVSALSGRNLHVFSAHSSFFFSCPSITNNKEMSLSLSVHLKVMNKTAQLVCCVYERLSHFLPNTLSAYSLSGPGVHFQTIKKYSVIENCSHFFPHASFI